MSLGLFMRATVASPRSLRCPKRIHCGVEGVQQDARMTNPRFRACLAAVALPLLACGSAPADSVGRARQSITSGTADDVDTAAVFIVAKTKNATGYCSGVVVSPHVILTAAHCASSDYQYSIFLGADYNDPAAKGLAENFVEVVEHHAHPKWTTARGDSNDVGVLITAAPIPRPSVAINRKPITPSDVGREIRIVGQGQPSGTDKSVGRRNIGVTKIAGFDETTLELAGAPNICLFDSGGPTFLQQDGVDVVAGIHAVVDSSACDGKGYDMRVDRYTDFIDQYIVAADPPDAGAPESDASIQAPSPPTTTSGCAISAQRSPRAFFGFFFSVSLFAAAIARRRRSSRSKGGLAGGSERARRRTRACGRPPST